MSAQAEFLGGTSYIIFEEIIKEAMNTRYVVSRFPMALEASLAFSLSIRIKTPRRTTGVMSIDSRISSAKSWNCGNSSDGRHPQARVEMGTRVSSLDSIAPRAHESRM